MKTPDEARTLQYATAKDMEWRKGKLSTDTSNIHPIHLYPQSFSSIYTTLGEDAIETVELALVLQAYRCANSGQYSQKGHR
ncbi:hypothetical protein PoB_007548300 [Plakobranchus ocellatus]|uniref:Uncharacterized protein n=1 Tax=Plakobranchus ocellatus TaxID=259542 RepID=A0AAV4DXJ1_9GAST|nr:hypothetical protein PoB_007548300 [Plakobranchus ocellatus]